MRVRREVDLSAGVVLHRVSRIRLRVFRSCSGNVGRVWLREVALGNVWLLMGWGRELLRRIASWKNSPAVMRIDQRLLYLRMGAH